MAEERKVGKDGSIRYKGKKYFSKALLGHVGEKLKIQPILEVKVLWVFDSKGKRICEAREKGVSFEETIGVSKSQQNKGDKDVIFGLGKKLKDYKTDDLLKELATRKNTTLFKMHEGQQYQVKNGQQRVKEWGPAVVVVVRK
ncbi:MAG: BC1881 family protein [Clostridiaceae bacterium]|nr:BC1881 family protein [Clostridiaceae bacterium]